MVLFAGLLPNAIGRAGSGPKPRARNMTHASYLSITCGLAGPALDEAGVRSGVRPFDTEHGHPNH